MFGCYLQKSKCFRNAVSLHGSCNLLREKALISTCMYHGALVGSKHFGLLKQISKYLKSVL